MTSTCGNCQPKSENLGRNVEWISICTKNEGNEHPIRCDLDKSLAYKPNHGSEDSWECAAGVALSDINPVLRNNVGLHEQAMEAWKESETGRALAAWLCGSMAVTHNLSQSTTEGTQAWITKDNTTEEILVIAYACSNRSKKISDGVLENSNLSSLAIGKPADNKNFDVMVYSEPLKRPLQVMQEFLKLVEFRPELSAFIFVPVNIGPEIVELDALQDQSSCPDNKQTPMGVQDPPQVCETMEARRLEYVVVNFDRILGKSRS